MIGQVDEWQVLLTGGGQVLRGFLTPHHTQTKPGNNINSLLYHDVIGLYSIMILNTVPINYYGIYYTM